ncbi:MAG: hypothetical protein US62_C0044G0006 [Candidatus Woesebacteria bacterium GW2011_GWA1_37_8]|uniref:Carrier domain-containing protein n=2 Tax=Candidatus Woeseibacteriota TaxID=1752722 RepID=A0A0G0L7N8_9BACT|nr:MAG: hypothetical protein US39_C0016G0028 [Microgenomates group bacterium GW2011_GWC1_37_12b]KKQ43678.1 MAG: hypothetical protein US62_C0044G0006 [Candidatus Woesebacteria bacterium GW2011_GWA1_37_8]KKQ87017.1 MAG: hypothetical protein UT10_C0012G0005 [Candidatus Woesebacteria bacterium GW2011_GWB1_38_8b]
MSKFENINKLLLFKQTLAEFLGLDVEDIGNDDGLYEELHMQPSDLSDFLHKLGELGFDTTKTDLTKVESVDDLIETLEIEENE